MSNAKYIWSSLDFECWIKQQKKRYKEAGFNISTSGVTKRLHEDVLVPNNINLEFPKIRLRRKK